MHKCPCMVCDKAGCGPYHDICDDYIQFKKEREKIYTDRIMRNTLSGMTADCRLTSYKLKHIPK